MLKYRYAFIQCLGLYQWGIKNKGYIYALLVVNIKIMQKKVKSEWVHYFTEIFCLYILGLWKLGMLVPLDEFPIFYLTSKSCQIPQCENSVFRIWSQIVERFWRGLKARNTQLRYVSFLIKTLKKTWVNFFSNTF